MYYLPPTMINYKKQTCNTLITHNQENGRIYKRATLPLLRAMDLARFLLAQSAIAMLVIIGFTPLALGKTEASSTYRPCVPQT